MTSPIWYTRSTGTATVAAQPALNVDLFPNPAATSATLSYYLPQASPVMVQVLDVLGRPVVTLSQAQAAGSQTLSIPTAQLEAGLYVVHMAYAGQVTTRKLLVVH